MLKLLHHQEYGNGMASSTVRRTTAMPLARTRLMIIDDDGKGSR